MHNNIITLYQQHELNSSCQQNIMDSSACTTFNITHDWHAHYCALILLVSNAAELRSLQA